jgi:hypothetical protein
MSVDGGDRRMAGNTHRSNCANAQNPGCECSGCGGSLHGWQGWTALAGAEPRARAVRRSELENEVQRDAKSGSVRHNSTNRQAYLNLARLDLAEQLWAEVPNHEPDGRVPESAAVDVSSDYGRVTVLGHTIMEKNWDEISAEIDKLSSGEVNARTIKKHLADHIWCTLLVAVIQKVESLSRAVSFVSDGVKRFLQGALVERLGSAFSDGLRTAVAGIVVDKVWFALTKLLEVHFPFLGTDILRALRMLAVFSCPSIERHPEVYEHAVRPLLGDAGALISEDVKAQVSELFDAWGKRQGW